MARRSSGAELMVAMVILAAANWFILHPPGGIWLENSVVDGNGKALDFPREIGKSVMGTYYPTCFAIFLVAVCTAFILPMVHLHLHTLGVLLPDKWWTTAQKLYVSCFAVALLAAAWWCIISF